MNRRRLARRPFETLHQPLHLIRSKRVILVQAETFSEFSTAATENEKTPENAVFPEVSDSRGDWI